VIQVQPSFPREPGDHGSAVAPARGSIRRIAGVTEMTSTACSSSTVVLQFDLNRNIDRPRASAAAITRAPPASPTCQHPSYRSQPADAPIMILALTSDIMPWSSL